MKSARMIVALVAGFALGAGAGYFLAHQGARMAVLSGPYSDHYGPARAEIASALIRLRSCDPGVAAHLEAADAHIERSQRWARRFLGKE